LDELPGGGGGSDTVLPPNFWPIYSAKRINVPRACQDAGLPR